MIIMALNSATLLFWAFRYMWFGIATIPPERMVVSGALYASLLAALGLSAIVRHEVNPNKKASLYY